ncbi:MAG: hypothetical protein A2051_00895 [Desulfovibrionales bacterium GWA2_65_9]|nr:MAG: hypothetical protein A2051_00895 [Desulfovibrionales bacterium GWA2_65_9]
MVGTVLFGIIFIIVVVIAVGLVNLFGGPSVKTDIETPPASLEELLDKPAPLFSLSDIAGRVYSNENLKGKNVMLFFNEGLRCYPACWDQMVSLGDPKFNNDEIATFSVVVDKKSDWELAAEKLDDMKKVNALFDDGTVSTRFGMLNTRSSMHRGTLPGHSYVILDKNGIVRFVLDDPRMAIQDDKLEQYFKQFEVRL